jgi:Mg/Co/Ni transporter MgtE
MLEILNYINNDYKPLKSNELVESAQDFFADFTFTHFPVVDNGNFIGNISSDDCSTCDSNKVIKDYSNALEPFFARNNMMWLDVLEIFAKNHTNIVPVLDLKNNYLGYYELDDLMHFFHDTPFLKENGGIIVIQKNIQEYSMSQMAQIIESNNGKILGMFVSEANLETFQVTIKITSGSLNEIIQTFRRYNYEIISEHQEDDYIKNLQERSDYLKKYLNI